MKLKQHINKNQQKNNRGCKFNLLIVNYNPYNKLQISEFWIKDLHLNRQTCEKKYEETKIEKYHRLLQIDSLRFYEKKKSKEGIKKSSRNTYVNFYFIYFFFKL